MKKTAKQKDPAAVALGRKRAAQMTTEERSLAGKARLEKLTAEQRQEIARKAVAARWAKAAAKKAPAKKPQP